MYFFRVISYCFAKLFGRKFLLYSGKVIVMRVKLKNYRDYPWYLKPFFWKQQRTYGQLLKPALAWGREPKLFAAVAALYGVLDRRGSPVSPLLRSLITVRVSQVNWCRFCVDINSSVLARRAGSMAKVEALEGWRESDLFTEQERAVLDYVEAMTYSDRQVSDEMVAELTKWFDNDGIVELTGLIAFQNLSSKFNSALDLPAQGFCQVPLPGDKLTKG
jgi:AhpD family alkylhydroperoxidase